MNTTDPAPSPDAAPASPLSATASDFLCAGFVAVFGLTVVLASADLALTNEMGVGPGYLPQICGWLLIGLAVLIALPATVRIGKSQTTSAGSADLRPQVRRALTVSAAVLGFALLLPHLGLVFAILMLVFIATRASAAVSLTTALLIGAALALVCTGLFVLGLGLPLPVWPAFPG